MNAMCCRSNAPATVVKHAWHCGLSLLPSCRDNHRISFQDPALADQIWTATGLNETLVGTTVDDMVPVGLNPNLRFYRYTQGQKFGKHVDDSVEVAPGQFTGVTGQSANLELACTRC